MRQEQYHDGDMKASTCFFTILESLGVDLSKPCDLIQA